MPEMYRRFERNGVTHLYSGPPINVCIEASWDAIFEGNLNTLEGEQFDWVRDVVSITRDRDNTMFETVRSLEALRRGEPNAGRMTLTIQNNYLAQIHFPEDS